VHVKLDTGMHRVGLPPDRAVDFVPAVLAAGLEFEGLWTHFAKADEPEDPFLAHQFEWFERTLVELSDAGVPAPRYRHVANSGAIIATPPAHLNLVRLGVAMYGLAPGPKLEGLADLRPAMRWRSEVGMAK